MPFGGFLDSFPSGIFIAAHIAFLVVGVWAAQRLTAVSPAAGPALWLYVITQVIFLMFFAGASTMKMAVLAEQTLLVVMVAWLATRSAPTTTAK